MQFHDRLIERAQQKRVSILLPEATDSRILIAAARANSAGIADCQLCGDADTIAAAARAAGVSLPDSLTITPAKASADDVRQLMKIRQQRGKPISEKTACQLLDNPITAAALHIKTDRADAMIAGAITASADVLRPALQIIGLQQGTTLASSAFLMCFPDGMRVFADCALNISPTADQLATIAVQSAATARAFGVSPVIAMLSYASGASGSGQQVEQVAAAAAQFRQQLPDTPITGPVQYDAAVSPAAAQIKLPDDAAAGKATVLIFPDLQAGNITYKAVQQTGDIVSIGPLLQGLAAPVNDLSRGATADDIYYTIAATAVQAQEMQLAAT